jgi:hypothetical protein
MFQIELGGSLEVADVLYVLLPPMPRGNWRSCLEACNGEHDLHHDDDQHVHRWHTNRPLIFLPTKIKQGSSHSSNLGYEAW